MNEEEITLLSPESFLEVRHAAERAAKRFKCTTDDLQVGFNWNEIAFYPPEKEDENED